MSFAKKLEEYVVVWSSTIFWGWKIKSIVWNLWKNKSRLDSFPVEKESLDCLGKFKEHKKLWWINE